jgi:hypothetical protein
MLSKALLRASTSVTTLFSFSVGASYTLRPRTFGSYGMSESDWNANFSGLGVPWAGLTGTALSYTAHPNESSRSNPQPGVMWGLTGFPGGVYDFTLAGGAGADADPGFGAPGGLATGRLTITPLNVLYFSIGQGGIYTGGADRSNHAPWYYPNAGGWNGGGAAGAQGTDLMYSGSGGGGTDIRLGGTALADRIMVVGGGGGATDKNYNTGGYGGGFNADGQSGGFQPGENPAGAGQGGTAGAGGSGAEKSGTVYESYMNGGLWFGGRGYDEAGGSINGRNAAGGGGGGYYGGGGAVDEVYPEAGGAGGGSGYANTSIVTVQSSSNGGAANGHPSWSWSASSVDSSGKTSFVDWNGSTFDPVATDSDNARYTTYRGDGTTINRRYGGNGWITIARVS